MSELAVEGGITMANGTKRRLSARWQILLGVGLGFLAGVLGALTGLSAWRLALALVVLAVLVLGLG
jgi:uncharacterized membrane protein YgaE (UPF0421/DUF939 family)